jgi:hypothetical protein
MKVSSSKIVEWQGMDGDFQTGFLFPCGKKYNTSYFTQLEAIIDHEVLRCSCK